MTVSLENLLVCFRRVSAVFAADRRRGPTVCVYILRVCVSSAAVLEADVVADLAGGARAGLRQEEPAVGAHANLVDGLPGPGGRGAAGGLPLGQPHQADPASVQRDLQRKGEGRDRKPVRSGQANVISRRQIKHINLSAFKSLQLYIL